MIPKAQDMAETAKKQAAYRLEAKIKMAAEEGEFSLKVPFVGWDLVKQLTEAGYIVSNSPAFSTIEWRHYE